MAFYKKKKDVLIPKFVLEDGYIMKSTADLNLFVKKTYGLNLYFKNYFYKRFEVLKTFNLVNNDVFEKILLKFFRFMIPQNKDFRYRYYAHLFFLYHLRKYKSYRHILCLPARGQRTWSNANTPLRRNVELRRIFAVKAWQSYPFLTRTYSLTAALAELSNKLWKTNWLPAWKEAKDSIQKTKKLNLVRIDLFAMSKFFNRVELGEYKISKKTKQKKKLEKKTSFTAGLEPGFAKLYLVKSARELRHINLQFYFTKTTRVFFEKENKKSKKKGGKGGNKLKLTKGVKSIKVARKMQKKKKRSVWD